MKIEDYKSINLRHLSGKELSKAYSYLKSQYKRSSASLKKKGYDPEPLRESRRELGYAKRVKDKERRMKREIAAMRKFYFTKVPGNDYLTRSKSSTVTGYQKVLEQTGRTLGIEDYANPKVWSEKQRVELWRKISKIRELGPEYFRRGRESDWMYQSATSFETISFLINNKGLSDPVEIFHELERKIQAARDGNIMTDEEFFR